MPEPLRNTFSTTYPGKAIVTICILALNAARLPFWMIYFIPSGLRQHPQWSWRQALRMRIVRAFLSWASTVEMLTPFDLSPSSEKKQWVTLEPAASKYFTGVATSDPTIKPTKIGATWYPAVPALTDKPKKVILHFHGGAYVIGDGRKKDAGFLAKTLLSNTDVPYIMCTQYRLASNDGGRFPAALQDAITSYTHLINDRGISPSNIIVSGDSAGANLTFCLLRYIRDNGEKLGIPNPGAALLWSPWVDPAGSTDRERFYMSPNEPTDYINPDFGSWGARCYMPLRQSTLTDEYINFKDHAFRTPTPLYFSIGENEMLMHDDFETAENFEKLGNRVEKSMEPYAPHDILLVGDKTSFDKEAAAAARKAGQFLSRL